MREAKLLAPTRLGHAHGPTAHDGTITTDAPPSVAVRAPRTSDAGRGARAIDALPGRARIIKHGVHEIGAVQRAV